MALGALLIQAEYGYFDEEKAHQIQETPCLQYFWGHAGYVYELPFDPSLMAHFRKRLSEGILTEVNEMIIAKAAEGAGETNTGTMMLDTMPSISI
ncbi:MAG: transposase [Eubacteriaceae bacterium]|nr:transposase [Eubacteriaceae bacterium]